MDVIIIDDEVQVHPGSARWAGDAGMTSGTDQVEFVGCCRRDGACGYLDDSTGFGCVKITDSLIGRLYGHSDVTCGS